MRTNRRRPWLLLSLFLFIILIAALPASAKEQETPKKPDKPDKDIIPGHYIVVLRDSVQDPDFSAGEVAKRHRFNLDGVYKKALKGFYARIPDSAVEAVAQDPDVASVEPDRMVYTAQQDIPTGVLRMGVLQNSYANINGVDDRVNVDIAILDTGIDLDHPDLNVFSSTNCARTLGGCKNGQGNDGHGHGSHVAGIAAALDNDFGVVGVAPGARLWAVKVLDDNGSGYLSWIIKGIDWVTARAADIEVASMSLAWKGYSQAAHTAIQNSVAKGVVYFAAAGNDFQDILGADGIFNKGSDESYPAAFPEVAAVSALHDTNGVPGGTSGTQDDSFADFSNFSRGVKPGIPVNSPGGAIDLMCPGVDIYSTHKDGGYETYSGTSMASPHAAGLAALYIAAHQRASNASGVYAIRQALIDSGVEQSSQYGLTILNDPDTLYEKLGWAGSSGAVTDIAVTAVVAPSSVKKGETVSVDVTVRNAGTQDFQSDITLELAEEPDEFAFDSQKIIGGLEVGASQKLTFSWSTGDDTLIGDHVLTASLVGFTDDIEANDVMSTTVRVVDSSTPVSVHVADLDGKSTNFGWLWLATVYVTVRNNLDQPVSGATISGLFSDGSTVFQCTTNGSGTCYVEGWQMWLNCLTYTVTNVSATLPYSPSENADPDGDSNGMSIQVCK